MAPKTKAKPTAAQKWPRPAEDNSDLSNRANPYRSLLATLPKPAQLDGDAPHPAEAAAYILEMSLALRNIANDTGQIFLAYLLDMAAEEADRQKQNFESA